jgi:nondiscriminating glutamyl-tRNA synthetase
VLQNKIERLSEIQEKARLFFQENAEPENEEAAGLLDLQESRAVFQAFLSETETVSGWDSSTFVSVMKRAQQVSGVKGKNLWMPIRAALTGQMHGPELGPVAEIFGVEKCRRLIEQALGRK